MGFLDKFKKKKTEKKLEARKPVPEVKPIKAAPKPKSTKRSVAKKAILIKPVITEKATMLAAENKYIFNVAPRASKNEIKNAIHGFYGVKPIKIRVINMSGRQVRWGRTEGKTKNRRKAIITLKPGDKIEALGAK